MIPKVIHYCWFGGNELNELAKMCIASWKKHCPDYEIVEWNEQNFDINSNRYVKEAYEAKKWAFITDYVRLYVLYNNGGIYMDTDVELITGIDKFLENKAFSGFENETMIPTAIMGAEKGNEWIGHLLSSYDDKSFILPDGQYDMTTNVITITNDTVSKYNVRLDNTYQEIDGVFTLYPKDYFCPKSLETGDLKLTENTTAIHHFNGSWVTPAEKSKGNIWRKYINKYGKELGEKKFNRYWKFAGVFHTLKYYGIKTAVIKIVRGLKTVLKLG